MKKSLFAAVCLSAFAVSSSAMALDVSRERAVRIEGFSGQGGSLGTLTFTALGANGESCDYLADWTSPFNPNDVVTCVLNELRTPFTPSCIANEREDITTSLVSAQPSMPEQSGQQQPEMPGWGGQSGQFGQPGQPGQLGQYGQPGQLGGSQQPELNCGCPEPQPQPQPVLTPVSNCSGFNVKGEASEDVSLILSEGAVLSGVEIIRTEGNPTIYPVVIE